MLFALFQRKATPPRSGVQALPAPFVGARIAFVNLARLHHVLAHGLSAGFLSFDGS